MSKMPYQKSLLTLVGAGIVAASTSTSLFAANEPSETIRSNGDHQVGKIRMLRNPDGAMRIRDQSQRPLSDKVASQFAPQFGIQNPARQLRVKKEISKNNTTTIRYRQQQNGIPVFAGELIANVNAQQQLTSMSGEISPMAVLNTTPAIDADQASQTALAAIAKWQQIEISNLVSNTPTLSIYDPGLLHNSLSSAQLVWIVNITTRYVAPVNEVVLVDAQTNGIVLHFSKTHRLINRETYNAGNQLILPGTLVCDEADPTCAAGDTDAQNAHNFVEDTYDYFFTTHNRRSFDGSDALIRSVVHYNTASAGSNAFWTGATSNPNTNNLIVYTDDMATDDVVAHEFTHGVTEHESGLLYYSESGAINESLSDIWGELVDQNNMSADDNATTAWQIGEGSALGVIRDMSNPALYGHPDSMDSPNFLTSFFDSGGVHINSGVNNKAAFLMVDGGTFNSETVSPMGATKTAHLYYAVQTSYLTTGSDYFDLNNALLTACDDLATAGSFGFIASDCTMTVQPALRAVRMDQTPNASYAPTAEVCPVGVNVYDLYEDDFELNNLNKWSFSAVDGLSANTWATSSDNLGTNSGSYTLVNVGSNSGVINDVALQTTTPIRVPNSEIAYIHFDQAFYFEVGVDQNLQLVNFDGGVIEYSTDNGANWIDAGSMVATGRGYTGSLGPDSPQPSRSAFVRYSNGFNSTRLNLTSLAGEFVLFRFRNIADQFIASGPWTIDNFRFYLCADNAPPIPNAGPDQSVDGDALVQLSGTATDLDGDTLTYSWTQVSGTTVTLTGANTLTPTFTSPRNDTNMVFELSVTDGNTTEVDTVSVAVQFFFSAASGGGGGGNGCSLSETGRFDPIWMLLLIFFATVHLVTRRKIQLRETGKQEKINGFDARLPETTNIIKRATIKADD